MFPTPTKELNEARVDVARVYELHRSELRSFFRNVTRGKNRNLDDLVHNVYLRLLEYPPSQILREPQAYLFKLAWSELHRFHRRSAREPLACNPELLEQLSMRTQQVQTNDDFAISTEELLTKIFADLPAVYGEVFVRFKWDGRTYKQIATELKLTPRQVKRYIAHTLQRLKLAQLQA